MGKLSKQNKRPVPKNGWKFQDDYTGAMKYSVNAKTDEDGWKTVGKPDKADPRRLPPYVPQNPLPTWTRPPQDNPDADLTYDGDTGY